MNLHRIKYPLAILTETDKIVHASEVSNGLDCNCHCPFCKEKLIAINNEGNKQKDHFRHNSNTNCKANYETFIHWLCKHVIKQLDSFVLPAISASNILFEEEFLIKRLTILKKHGLGQCHLNPNNEQIQPETRIPITNCRDEVRFETRFGPVTPDIVIYHEDSELFIEPFLTNPINSEKHPKLIDLNKSVIAIDLRSFVEANEFLFTLEKFTTFLRDTTSSKNWIVIRREKIEKLKKAYLIDLEKRLSIKSEIIKEYKDLEKHVANSFTEIGTHNMKIAKLHSDISIFRNRRKEIEIELGIVD